MLFGPKPEDLGKCPACDEPLVVLELRGVEIDHCLECSGTWLDAGELEAIAERAGADAGSVTKALHAARASEKRSERRCPRCAKRLETATVGSESPVEIDRCPKGHGLWLDRGEMLSLVEASSHEGEEGAIAAFFADFLRYEVQTKAQGE